MASWCGEPVHGAVGGTGAVAPGPVDVRLLTMTPRLDGLREDLPPNRARRAVELVAYLALHQPDVITGDRLRTRVLGSSDADAASKTLFNTAYAARRAMGVDQLGAPLFPAGTRNGLYQVSPLVTVDVHRAIALVEAARSQPEPDLAIAHYPRRARAGRGRAAGQRPVGLFVVGGRGSRGTGCRRTRGRRLRHGGAGVRCGASRPRPVGSRTRARLVEPYSEALSRAAMQLAAAEGDADRLRLEWRECCRRVDALDPGSSPSSRTESLYGELSRRVALRWRGPPTCVRPRYAPVVGD